MEEPPVYLEDIIYPNRRISRGYFRVLLILIFFSPLFVMGSSVLIPQMLSGRRSGLFFGVPPESVYDEFVWILGTPVAYVILVILINRMRDTGHSIFWLFVPFYNLYLLVMKKSA